eukprot:CAMPEP_0197622816 /NCGR_PEP_ID=MMETSP1338-20131121/2952_1 /TAXON_ID=43686 ORGANISM="Pelagodinium beii, Strain RCC1491" /NCGR_SAMPLE_ID=MMETSP1338 /ASSEMBLY_ACC=CAM_ASM_000754 /LENGTH=301 /DNA_ID=CAMNT_0043192575 /DNA_START=141 /DNA_END=1043 /DNA_ORIENTATION=+
MTPVQSALSTSLWLSGDEPMKVTLAAELSEPPITSKVALDDKDPKDRSRYELQFYKTKQCSFWEKGKCARGNRCNYAHGNRELTHRPDLTKTSLCRKLANCTDPQCCFAHNPEELRATDRFFKTSLCKFHMVGRCRLGEECRHAHGEHELQPLSQAQSFPIKPKRGSNAPEKKPKSGLDWDQLAWHMEAEQWKFNSMNRMPLPVPAVTEELLWNGEQLLLDVQRLVDDPEDLAQTDSAWNPELLSLKPHFATSFFPDDMEELKGYNYQGSRSTTYQDLPHPEVSSQESSEPEENGDELKTV